MPRAMFLTPATRAGYLDRISCLTPESARRWGALTAHGVLAHLIRTLEICLGDVETRDASNFLLRTVVCRLVYQSPLPWPRGRIKAPAIYTPEPKGDFEAERRRLIETMDRFLELSEAEPDRLAIHPAFGPRTLRYWQRIHGMHMDYHLKQFGA